MKRLFVILILFVLVFSGCSLSSSSSSSLGKDKEVVKTGYGLEIDFSVDTKYINKQKVLYDLNLKNTGLKEVILTRENFKFYVEEQYVGFTKESVDELYNKLFDTSSQISFVTGQEKKVSGMLVISDNYKDYPNSAINYDLQVTYNYKTLFDNNLEFVYNRGMYELRTLDTISQAAPLQISNIKLVPDVKKDEYLLEFYFDDRGKSYFTDDNTQIKIEDIKINLGTDEIAQNCRGSQREGDKEKESLDMSNLNIKRKYNLVVECRIILDKTQSFTTKTFGEFSYTYKINKKGTINIPKE